MGIVRVRVYVLCLVLFLVVLVVKLLSWDLPLHNTFIIAMSNKFQWSIGISFFARLFDHSVKYFETNFLICSVGKLVEDEQLQHRYQQIKHIAKIYFASIAICEGGVEYRFFYMCVYSTVQYRRTFFIMTIPDLPELACSKIGHTTETTTRNPENSESRGTRWWKIVRRYCYGSS